MIAAELAELEGFDEQFRDLVEAARVEGGGDQTRERAEIARGVTEVARQRENLLAAIADYGPKPMFQEKLSELEASDRASASRLRELDRLRGRPLDLPDSTAELRRLMEEKFRDLALDSPEFGNLLRKVVPEFHVHVVRLLDGGHLLPRARITLDLGGLVADAKHAPGMKALLRRERVIDLFEPPQRERIRVEATRLAGENLKQLEIAKRLPEKVSPTAVGNALALGRLMVERGVDSPYEVVYEPPADYPKLRRHKHPSYRFEPIEGHEPPAI